MSAGPCAACRQLPQFFHADAIGLGIGIAVEEVAGTLVVRELIEGGPAADSGLAPGDRVLGATLSTYFATRPDPVRPPLHGGGLDWAVEVP